MTTEGYKINGQEATREQVEQYVAALRQRGARPGEGITLCPDCQGQGTLAPLMLAAPPKLVYCQTCQRAWTREEWHTLVQAASARMEGT